MSSVPKKKLTKAQRIRERLGITRPGEKDNQITNLTKVPPKVKDSGHFNNFEKFSSIQADLLFLPHDFSKGTPPYKYALVAVDTSSRLVDARPLKSKKPEAVLTALKSIFNGKYLRKPTVRLVVDNGKEFQGAVAEWCRKEKINLKVSKTARHRQTAIVERMNATIGRFIAERQGGEELRIGEENGQNESVEWVDDLPKIIEEENKEKDEEVKPAEERMKDLPPPKCTKTHGRASNCEVLPHGTKVRVILEQPKSIATGKRLHGGFRKGDQRWEKTVRTIVKVVIKAGSSVLYKVSGDDMTAKRALYPREQLQIVKSDEQLPPSTVQRKWIVEKILDHKPKRGKIKEYLIKWKGWGPEHDSWEPAENMEEDIPSLVSRYLKSKGKK